MAKVFFILMIFDKTMLKSHYDLNKISFYPDYQTPLKGGFIRSIF